MQLTKKFEGCENHNVRRLRGLKYLTVVSTKTNEC